MSRREAVFAAAALLLLAVLAGCGSGGGSVPGMSQAPPDSQIPAAPDGFIPVALVGFQDAWPDAAPRWMDVADFAFTDAFQSSFSSSHSGTVTVAYHPTAADGALDVRVLAQGLKPNFCYQVKLVGKPGDNAARTGLWGSTGTADMAGNTQILLAGRYWDYSTETPFFNTTNRADVVASAYYGGGWVAGYLVLGCFVTDADGNTPGWVRLYGDDGTVANHGSYHVVWKTGQSIPAGSAGPYRCTFSRASSGSGAYPSGSIGGETSLYLEREPGVAQPYRLPQGSYDVVLMLTEESFHSARGSLGGYWNTVRVTDWSPVTSPKHGTLWISSGGGRVQFTVP